MAPSRRVASRLVLLLVLAVLVLVSCSSRTVTYGDARQTTSTAHQRSLKKKPVSRGEKKKDIAGSRRRQDKQNRRGEAKIAAEEKKAKKALKKMEKLRKKAKEAYHKKHGISLMPNVSFEPYNAELFKINYLPIFKMPGPDTQEYLYPKSLPFYYYSRTYPLNLHQVLLNFPFISLYQYPAEVDMTWHLLEEERRRTGDFDKYPIRTRKKAAQEVAALFKVMSKHREGVPRALEGRKQEMQFLWYYLTHSERFRMTRMLLTLARRGWPTGVSGPRGKYCIPEEHTDHFNRPVMGELRFDGMGTMTFKLSFTPSKRFFLWKKIFETYYIEGGGTLHELEEFEFSGSTRYTYDPAWGTVRFPDAEAYFLRETARDAAIDREIYMDFARRLNVINATLPHSAVILKEPQASIDARFDDFGDFLYKTSLGPVGDLEPFEETITFVFTDSDQLVEFQPCNPVTHPLAKIGRAVDRFATAAREAGLPDGEYTFFELNLFPTAENGKKFIDLSPLFYTYDGPQGYYTDFSG